MMDLQETQDLLERALSGVPAAQCELVDLLTPVIQKRVARELLRWRQGASSGRDVRQEVEDLSQEVFLHLFSKDAHVLRRWNPELGLSLLNYVGLVAGRCAGGILRSKHSPWIYEPTPAEKLDRMADSTDQERAAIYRERLRLLRYWMKKQLSAEGWHMFHLLFRQEKSPEEVARITGKSLDAVYKWQSRLRQLARLILDELSNSDEDPQKP